MQRGSADSEVPGKVAVGVLRKKLARGEVESEGEKRLLHGHC